MKTKRCLIFAICIVLLLLVLTGCSKAEYTLTFDSRGGSEVKEVVKITAWSKTLNLPEPTRDGYIFDGWYTDIYCTMPATLANIRLNALDNLVLYAKWKGAEHTVYFDSNGGKGSMAAQAVPFSDSLLLPPNTFTKFGYSFLGWAESGNGQVVYANQASFTMLKQADVTLYAIWSFNSSFYNLSFFEERIANLMEKYPEQDTSVEECIFETHDAIGELLEELELPSLLESINFIVSWETPCSSGDCVSLIFSMEDDLYAVSFKELLADKLMELNEHAIEVGEQVTVFSFEVRGNLIALTMGEGDNLLINEDY